jgi:hypothetical protein
MAHCAFTLMAKRSRVENWHDDESKSVKPTAFPSLTHLQFLVLDLLGSSPDPLPAQLISEGVGAFFPDYSGPKFYQLMARIAEAGLIEAKSRNLDVAGGTVTRSYYRSTPEGRRAWRVSLDFYATRQRIAKLLGKSREEQSE